jgi:hypothetical protein
VWHASVAIRTPGGRPKPVVQWTLAEWSRVEQALRRALRGVGEGEEMTETMPHTLQMRRRISGAEFAIIGPAIDIRPR